MISDIDTIALEAAQDVAKISRSMPVGGHSQMVAQMQCRIINAIDEAKRAAVGSAEPVGEVRYDSVRGWHMRAMKDWASMGRGTKLYTAPPAPVSAEPVTPFAFVIVDKNGNPEFATTTHDEAQAHINDAISEHNIQGAGKWRSIPAYEMRPSDDKLWDQTLRERDYNAEIADKLAGAIGEYFKEEIGEHSNANCPWLEALRAIEESTPSTDAKDSERYRWLRDNPDAYPCYVIYPDSMDSVDSADMDKLIDAAIAAKEAGK